MGNLGVQTKRTGHRLEEHNNLTVGPEGRAWLCHSTCSREQLHEPSVLREVSSLSWHCLLWFPKAIIRYHWWSQSSYVYGWYRIILQKAWHGCLFLLLVSNWRPKAWSLEPNPSSAVSVFALSNDILTQMPTFKFFKGLSSQWMHFVAATPLPGRRHCSHTKLRT